MSLIDLPRELHLIIVSYLDMGPLSRALALLLTCKKFAWLKNYRLTETLSVDTEGFLIQDPRFGRFRPLNMFRLRSWKDQLRCRLK